jgi:hypothetical protein
MLQLVFRYCLSNHHLQSEFQSQKSFVDTFKVASTKVSLLKGGIMTERKASIYCLRNKTLFCRCQMQLETVF